MIKKRNHFSPVWFLPVLFFLGMWLFGETGLYNDSNQYIAMHIHREPFYPFFLWIFRSVFGEASYLEIVRLIQNIFAAFSVIWLTDCIRREFGLNVLMSGLICLLQLAPHVITPLFSESGLALTNGIISEAFGLSFFYLFEAECLKMIFHKSRRAALAALLLAVLLALTRGQLMTAVLLWAVLALAVQIASKSWKRMAVVLLCTLLAFGCRTLLVKSYNLAFNGHFINNTFGSVGMLANMLYAADREDGERIADEKAREFFNLSFDLADELEANYRYSPDGFLNRAAHLEKWHDALKFDLIEEPWRAVHDETGLKDYILENREADRVAGQIMKSIFPALAGRWLYNYLALSVYGLIRSVAVVRPLFNWYAAFLYLFAAALAGYTFYKDKRSKAVWVAAFAFLAVFANVYATSLIIMCLSRYMIYGLPLFYTGVLLLLHENALRLKKPPAK